MMPLTEVGSLGAAGSLIAALAIGFAFGWCLERGGLGSAPKLAGQFYLADLTVFKVMFSALVTAMLGAFWLDALGLLDLSLVYLPETFATPQAIGGTLFGAGFLLAGLCPGTSCVAAAVGRIDGVAVIAGMLGGVLLFNVGYPHLEGLYTTTSWGAITIADLVGMPRGVMVAIVTALALGAFALAGRSFVSSPEGDMVRRQAASPGVSQRHRAFAGIAAALALAAAALDLRATDAKSLAGDIEHERDHISAPDLAQLIMDGDRALRIFDLRSPAEFERLHIPGATHATIEALGETLARERLPRDATVVLYSEGGSHAAQGWVLLRMRGHRRVYFLREGLFERLARVMEPRLAIDATPRERAEFARAIEMSRFFGGTAREGVSRSEVPIGYWNTDLARGFGLQPEVGLPAKAGSHWGAVARIRRRGC